MVKNRIAFFSTAYHLVGILQHPAQKFKYPIIFIGLLKNPCIRGIAAIKLFLFMVAYAMPASSQVNFFYNDSAIDLHASEVQYFVDTGHNRSYERFSQIKQALRPMSQNDVNLSYKNEMLWLKISGQAIAESEGVRYLMVRNPHINYVGCWILNDKAVEKAFSPSGDHLPFYSRSFPDPNFIFPLSAASIPGSSSIILLLDKRHQQLNIPIHFFSDQGLHNYNLRYHLLAGFIAGLGIFIFLLNLFLFFKMKEQLYVYYGLYVFLIFFYIVSDYGLSFMYLFPGIPKLADLTRPVAISLGAPLYVLFALQFFKAKQQMPLAYIWIKRFLYFYVVMLAVGMMLMPGKGAQTTVLLWTMQIVQLLNTVLVLLLGIIGLRQKLRYSVYFIISSFLMLSGFLLYGNYLSGYLADNFFTRNIVNLAFSAEVALLAFVLALRFRDYKEESEQLLKRVNIQQEQIFRSLSDFEEKQRLRLSSLLHDSFGATLSAIRLNLESLELSAPTQQQQRSMLVRQVNDLAVEVREISHNLSPVLLQRKGLVKAVEHIVEGINSAGSLYIQFESIGSVQQIPFRYGILLYNVIQELLQNIMKHAAATEGIVQLALEPDLVYLFVEDNGNGHPQTEMKEGLGYIQIKELLKFVNGRMMVKADNGEGFQITIEFPILEYEPTLSNSDS